MLFLGSSVFLNIAFPPITSILQNYNHFNKCIYRFLPLCPCTNCVKPLRAILKENAPISCLQFQPDNKSARQTLCERFTFLVATRDTFVFKISGSIISFICTGAFTSMPRIISAHFIIKCVGMGAADRTDTIGSSPSVTFTKDVKILS